MLELRDHDGRPTWLGCCPGCGLVQASERPSNLELERYYSKYCYTGDAAWVVTDATLKSLRRVTALLGPYRQLNRCLDVGCGAGAFLTAFAKDGWAAEGTELSSVAAERLESMGFRIHAGAIEDLRLPEQHYDVAILSEVLEHLRDPRAALANTVRGLRRGGAVYLTTPNYAALSRRVLGSRWRIIGVPEHLYYFSRRSLAALLAAVGLVSVRIWTEGVNPYELVSCWRARERSQAVAEAVQAQGEALRQAAAQRPWVGALKSAVNLGLQTTGLGDTLKCLAVRA